MERIAFGLICSILVLALGLPSKAQSQEMAPEFSRLKLYVGEVKGDQELLESVRAQLVDELTKRGVALVASEEEADATLTSTGVHRTGTRVTIRTRPTVLIAVRGHLQLIARDGSRLWMGDASSARWAFSETASFAQNAASRVARALRAASGSR